MLEPCRRARRADLVMVATTAVNPPRTAETIARACSSRGVMTVGVILQRGCPDGPALRACGRMRRC